MFWHGGPLPPYAWPCLCSFIERGHAVRLYAYEPLETPRGVLLADARTILSIEEIARYHGIEAFADAFRYELLFREGGWWADVDVLCLTERLPEATYAWAEEEPGVVNNAILKFPKAEPLFAELATRARTLAQQVKPWGATGPRLLSAALRALEPADKAGSSSAFYPLHWLEAPQLLMPRYRSAIRQRIKDVTFLHLWASALKDIGISPNDEPPPGSFMHDLLAGLTFERPSTLRSRWAMRRAIRMYYRQSWVADHWTKVFGQGPGGRMPITARPDATVRGLTRRTRRSVPAFATQARHALRAKALSASLPPGKLDPLDRSMDVDQQFVLKSAAKWGPVFKSWWHGGYTTCIVGHARGRQLLAENEDRLVPRSIDLSALFPKGWIRTMRGSAHQQHRRLVIQALSETPISVYEAEFRRVIHDGLAVLVREHGDLPARQDVRAALRATTSAIMLRLLFGVAPASLDFDELQRQYRRFGPDAPPHALDPQRCDAFSAIKACVDRLRSGLANGANGAPSSMLKHLIDTNSDDDTALGTLMFLFEPAHFDVYSLWHWLLYYLAKNSHVAARIVEALGDDRAEADRVIRATVLEILRLNQSEVLYRQATDDVIFEGHLMPKGEVVRVCLWEGHKDEAVFADPFAFRPERFLEREFGLDQFAPFGLDKHRCIGADLTLALTALFTEELCKNFACTLVADGPPLLGAFHWEPSVDSLISLSQRD
jgi:cytochrome P450